MLGPAEILKRSPTKAMQARPGRDDVDGFAVVALPFSSGDILCLRRWPGSTFGPGYTSVWHRSPAGEWTVYTSIAPALSCPRFIGAAISRAVETPIELEWTGPSALSVRVPAAELRWDMRFESTPITRLMNAMMALLPRLLYRSNLVLAMMSAMATVMLAAGRFRLLGTFPNRQWFQAGPRKLWFIPEARAALAGRDLGALGPLAPQAIMGDVPLPQRGILMLGGISSEAYAPERHLPVPVAEILRPALHDAR
ncbi:MAG TPA: hypothetical protein VHL80_11800 [Polyangia bacterium]|nr:hypothetical protein [Polyangia bacterium]